MPLFLKSGFSTYFYFEVNYFVHYQPLTYLHFERTYEYPSVICVKLIIRIEFFGKTFNFSSLKHGLFLHSLLLHQSKHDERIRGMENFKISVMTLLFLDEKFAATCISHVHTELLYTRTVYILKR
jgi:hypothetical protein